MLGRSRMERLLPTHYFHIVVTLPHELNPLVLYDKPLMYGMLFRCASCALLDCARNWKRLGAHIGFTAVLHTWNQDLSFHPHLHIIATGGGLDESQSRWISSKTNFLVPVRLLSRSVRDLFCHAMQEAFSEGKIAFPASLSTRLYGSLSTLPWKTRTPEVDRLLQKTLWRPRAVPRLCWQIHPPRRHLQPSSTSL